MPQPIPEAVREKVVRLLGEGVSQSATARAAGVSARAVGRISAGMMVSDSRVPFSGGDQDRPNIPPADYTSDQPRPPPVNLVFDRQYHAHTFKSFSAPVAFDGWTLQRARNAISMHRQGNFLESSTLALVLLSFAPVLAATSQRLAPAIALPRKIKCGERGMSRILGEEIASILAPSDGLIPSPYFPPTLWGAMGFDLTYMGFSVLQHAYGEEDPETGVRPCYTRRWPSWATAYYRYRRQLVALTNDGPVDIVSGDGKWTIICDNDEPHFFGAIVALPEEVISGIFSKRALANYIDKYGNPKWVATMPPGTGVRTPEGEAAMAAISTIRGPDGYGAVPNGMTMELKGLVAGASTVVKDSLDSHWQYIAAALLGSDGTMSKGTGVYSAPIFAGVRRDLVDRDLRAELRGVNSGVVAPYLSFNYGATIAEARGWKSPVLDIPLPDPDADARIKSYSDRVKSFHEVIAKERDNGFEVTQERVNQLARSLEIDTPTLLTTKPGEAIVALSQASREKVTKVDEGRRSIGLPPTGDERGEMFISELTAPAETTAQVEDVGDGGGTNGEPEKPKEGGDDKAATGERNS